MRPRGTFAEKREPKEYEERVIEIARVSRVVKGGRRIRFRALVVLGNRAGKVGMGVAKANEVAEAVKKAATNAKKHIKVIPIINGSIPHEVYAKHGGAKIMLKPAASGTSIVAGGSVRSVAELSGITDLLAKSLGSSNKINNVTATIKALCSFNQEVVDKVKEFSKRAELRLGAKTEAKEEPKEKAEAKEEKPAEKKTPEAGKIEKEVAGAKAEKPEKKPTSKTAKPEKK